ncbi:MAG: sugar phosphate isomerase/epimerase family protein [Thermoproteota archaeon]
MDYGFDTWIYSIIDADKALERMRRNGVKFIEISYEHLHKCVKNGEIDFNAFKRIKNAADSLGIRIVQVHGPFGNIDFELSSANPSEREKALRTVFKWIEYIGRLEWEVLVLHTVRLKPSENDNIQRVVEKTRLKNIAFFKEAAEYASEYGVKICVENRLENIYGALPADLLSLIEDVGKDSMGICLDTGHANVNGIDPSVMVEMLKESLAATHIHDNDGHEDQHLSPLMGSIDWPRLLKAFSRINYTRPLILEIHEYKRLDIDDNVLRASSILMDRLLKEY